MQVFRTATVADAGSPQELAVGSLVTLDGSGSMDPEGAALSYAWSQVSGPGTVTFGDPLAVDTTTSFSAGEIGRASCREGV